MNPCGLWQWSQIQSYLISIDLLQHGQVKKSWLILVYRYNAKAAKTVDIGNM